MPPPSRTLSRTSSRKTKRKVARRAVSAPTRRATSTPRSTSATKPPAKPGGTSKKRASRTTPRASKSLRPKKLRGLSDIRRYFNRCPDPFYFISATNFNLIGIDEWVGNFTFINYLDCFAHIQIVYYTCSWNI